MRKVMLMSLATVAASLSVNAFAGDFTIYNNTDKPVTSIINDSICSDLLGADGVAMPHQPNTIHEAVITAACSINNPTGVPCKVAVHMSMDCSGPVVAIVSFDTKEGIVAVEPKSAEYSIYGQGFEAHVEATQTR